MKRYPQRSLIHPWRTLVVWLAVIASGAIAAACHRSLVRGSASEWRTVAGGVMIATPLFGVVALRSWQAIVATMAVILAALAVSAGVMVTCDQPIDARIAVLVVVLAVQSATFFVHAYRDRIRRERALARPLPRDHRYVLSEALRDLRGASALATTCPVIVFVILCLHRESHAVGLFLLVGWLATVVATRTIVPALFALAPVDVTRNADGTLGRFARYTSTQPKLIGAIGLGVAAGAIVIAVLKIDLAGETPALLQAVSVAVIAVWVASCLGLRSLTLGSLPGASALASIAAAYAVVALVGRPLDGDMLVGGAFAIASLTYIHARTIATWAGYLRRADGTPARSAEQTVQSIAVPTLWAALASCAGLATIGAGRVFVLAIFAGAVWGVLVLPALLAAQAKRVRPPLPEDRAKRLTFKKGYADEKRPKASMYTDDEIASINTADFLALAGKTVIRHGGSHGTRRMLAELDIPPHGRVLELGAGVGATAFDLIAFDSTVHVTGVDLSAFMIEKSKQRATERNVSGDRLAFVHSTDPSKLPFEDATFDAVIAESVAMYNDSPTFFREVFRVLKPGGRVGLHDWCWVSPPTPELEVNTCVLACGCNPGDVRFYTQDDWEHHLRSTRFEIRYGEQYPFTFFSWSTMQDDEGLWPLLRMFGRVLSRAATAKRMFEMTTFLARHEGTFGYTVTIGQKPGSTAHMETVQ